MRFILTSLYAPIVFMLLLYFNKSLENILALKIVPFALSSTITFAIIISYIKKKSLILYFAQKISKIKISTDEIKYIHDSTIFWIIISFINATAHYIIFLDTNNTYFWIFYSSIGWCILFICAGILQYLHRRFIFLRREKYDT